MRSKFWWWKAVALAASLSSTAWSGTLGKVVTIGPDRIREKAPAYPMPCWDKR